MVELVQRNYQWRDKMKKIVYCLLLGIIFISACSPQANADSPQAEEPAAEAIQAEEVQEEAAEAESAGFTVTDALEREVTFEEYPTDIVIAGKLRPMIVDFLYLFESAPEKIAAIEAGGQASENFITLIDEDIESKYSLEKGASAEQIAPVEPDLVILKSSVKEDLGDQLETVGIPVVYVDFETMDQIYRDIRILGTVLGENERAEGIVAKYEEIYAEFKGYVDASTEGKSAVLMQISDSEQQYAYEVPSVSYLQTVLVEEAGGDVLWAEAAQAGGWNEVNIEQVNVWDPDQIFVINYQGKAQEIIDVLSAEQPFGSLAAVQNGKISAFPFDYISWDQPDPRWIMGYSWLVYKLNPDAVSQDRMLELVFDFYSFFYGLDKQRIDENILTRVADYY
jgi:iron complex transport system substrate-binding protein